MSTNSQILSSSKVEIEFLVEDFDQIDQISFFFSLENLEIGP
jgi:hypothetical protein